MTAQNEKGFTLLEIIMAVSILSIGILAVASMQGAALKGDSFAQSRTEGSTYGQDMLEELLTIPYDDAKLNNNATDSVDDGDYRTEYLVVDGTILNTKKITVTVSYRGKQINQMVCVRSMMLE